jgi:predicted DNA-binding protein (UPF0251 family)
VNLGEFYTANTHVNPVTGCVIWDGETSKGVPILAGVVVVQVRKFVYESISGNQPYRTKYIPSCENPLCVKLEHIEAIAPEKQVPQYPQEKLDEVWRLYSEGGMRQDAIASKLGIDASTVSKYLKAAKTQHSITEVASES